MADDKILLEIKRVSKQYPGVRALKDVSFTINKGEVHAVVGENGAGKSTLMKILSGVETMTSGELILDGKPIRLTGIKDAIDLGINLISQELNIAPDMTAYENIFIGSEIGSNGMLNRREMRAFASGCWTVWVPPLVPTLMLEISASLNSSRWRSLEL